MNDTQLLQYTSAHNKQVELIDLLRKQNNELKENMDNSCTGTASELQVCAWLMRMGYEAYITMGNRKHVDIRVVRGDRTCTIDVKAVRGYSSWIINNVTALPAHFIVFLCYDDRFDDVTHQPDVYVVPSGDVERVQSVYGTQRRITKSNIKSYQNAWNLLLDVS